jgi:acetate kinase
MNELLLVLNTGSSSLKFAAYRLTATADWAVVTRGQIEGIGTSPHMSARDGNGAVVPTPLLGAVQDGHSAFEQLVLWLRATFENVHLLGVGHRVVHGGSEYAGPALVTPAILAGLRALSPLAPLHQPYNLAPIELIAQRLPSVAQVACFDTSFHLDKPAVARVVPLPRDVCGTAIQRYGFHGISCEYIAAALPQVAAEIADRRVIVAHLGSGASVCARCGPGAASRARSDSRHSMACAWGRGPAPWIPA